ncbi:MAG: EAL domain-containing protein [Methylococcaceae bacterium]|nr:MAG: EAL domain-containing protein [Methylococcaceae bacterium]
MNVQPPEKPLILLVDDIPANLHVLASALKQHYEIKMTTSGAAALELAQQDDQPQLILLDVVMPGMDGIEVLRRLRENPKTYDIPVIFISADASEQSQLDGLELGADDYLIKPVVTKILLVRVHNLIQRKRAEVNLRIAAIAFESQEAMVITDADNIILRVNRAFTETTGYTAEEAVGNKMNLLRSGRHDPHFYALMWQSIQQYGSWQGEIWDRRKNGEIYLKWLTITAVTGRHGEITHYVGTQTDITERKAAEERTRYLAHYDPLTQLPNRRLLYDRLEHGIRTAVRDGKQMALLMLDLDRFKDVNDSLGHLAGDELLQQVAGRLSARLRKVDTVARLGGDEFIVLLEDIARPEDAARVAEVLIKDLSKPFRLTQGDDVRIGASIGISLHPQHGDHPKSLMEDADTALYQAKAQGRGCFAFFSAEKTQEARERIAFEMRLRRALEQQELRIFYQPQMDIASGCIVGAEALVRWLDPEVGFIPPFRFIAVAEETGLIDDLGRWVLREVCRQGRQWLDAGLPPINLGVNISPRQFRRRGFSEMVAEILAETGFPSERLELEVTERGLLEYKNKTTESGLMESQDQSLSTLNNLRNQGVHIAIDDFGTGYSSLAYLKRFPMNVLKIDKSFIDDIPNQKSDAAIASTIIAMGHTLGFKVLAEGVETTEQLEFLRAQGCDLYQGYLNSRPMPSLEFASLLGEAGSGG